MSEPFTKDSERRARDSQPDTSFEKVWRYECGKNKTMVLKYEGHWVKYSDYAALAAERDALQAKLAKAVARAEVAEAKIASVVDAANRWNEDQDRDAFDALDKAIEDCRRPRRTERRRR